MSSNRESHRSAPDHVAAQDAIIPVSHIVAPLTAPEKSEAAIARPIEIGGREGPEPTRFGDWERRGRCIDF